MSSAVLHSSGGGGSRKEMEVRGVAYMRKNRGRLSYRCHPTFLLCASPDFDCSIIRHFQHISSCKTAKQLLLT